MNKLRMKYRLNLQGSVFFSVFAFSVFSAFLAGCIFLLMNYLINEHNQVKSYNIYKNFFGLLGTYCLHILKKSQRKIS